MNGNTASLIILEQSSLSEDKFSKNGELKNVHVVVKNNPFFVRLGLESNDPLVDLDFDMVSVDVQLCYDCDGDRVVDYVRTKPFEYRGIVNEHSDKMTLEVRIKILSSHLEDMLFKLRIRAVDNLTREEIPSLCAMSQPIKVVSKPEQVTRLKRTLTGKKTPRVKKPSTNELMLETLKRIEQQQQEHQSLLQHITQSGSNLLLDTCKVSLGKRITQTSSLESALENLIKAYKDTPFEERPTKIRKFVQNTSDTEILTELSDQLQYSVSGESKRMSTLDADELEYQHLDDFYNELLFPSNTTSVNI